MNVPDSRNTEFYNDTDKETIFKVHQSHLISPDLPKKASIADTVLMCPYENMLRTRERYVFALGVEVILKAKRVAQVSVHPRSHGKPLVSLL